MRVFVYEYLSTGAMAGQPGAESLLREGRAMLVAAAADLGACPGVRAVALPSPIHGGSEEYLFRRLASDCDAALIIAPEFDDILARRADWAVEEGARLLGPSSDAIRLTGDKLTLAAHMTRHEVPTPPTALYQGGDCPFGFPAVVKPRFGAGAQDTFQVCQQSDYLAVGEVEGEKIVQPEWSDGTCVPASVSFLVGPLGAFPLMPGLQEVTISAGRYSYQGGRVPLDERLRPVAIQLARRAVECVPGLHGYVGVDVAVSWSGNGAVIEINPRLTTSYVGLRRLARFNIMQAMLDILAGKPPPSLEYSPDEVVFHPDGTIPNQAGA